MNGRESAKKAVGESMENLKQEFRELKCLMHHIRQSQTEISRILLKRGILTESQLADVRSFCGMKPRIQKKKKSFLKG